MAITDIGNNLFRNEETGQVVDKNHPIYQQWVTQGLTSGASGGAPTATGGGGSVTGASVPGASVPLSQQAAGASTVSGTPGAAPTGPTSNQGSQDVARNSYLAMATQSRVPSRTDPEIRVPADAFAANVDRSVRNQTADAAERQGPYASGAVRGEARMAAERGAVQAGAYEAELVNREVGARRAEIQQALAGLSGFISDDQRMALQRELAQLNARLEQQRLGQQSSQFADTLGFNIAQSEADLNDRALRLILGGV